MTILGREAAAFQRELRQKGLWLAVAASFVICLNIFLALLRTDRTHTLFLWVNILSDLALIWGSLAAAILYFRPNRRLLRLYARGQRRGKNCEAVILEISRGTLYIQGFPCYTVLAREGEDISEFYLIEDTLSLEPGRRYGIETVDRLLYAAEVLE